MKRCPEDFTQPPTPEAHLPTSSCPLRGLRLPSLPRRRIRSPASCAVLHLALLPVLRASPTPSSRRLPAHRAAHRPPYSLRSPSRLRRREGVGERYKGKPAVSLLRRYVVSILSKRIDGKKRRESWKSELSAAPPSPPSSSSAASAPEGCFLLTWQRQRAARPRWGEINAWKAGGSEIWLD